MPDLSHLAAHSAPHLSWEEITGVPMTAEEFEARLAPLSVEDCILTLGKLNRKVADVPAAVSSIDAKLARSFTVGRERALHLISAGSRLATFDSLTTLMREAIVRSERRPADNLGGGLQFPNLIDALAGVFDLYDPVDTEEPSETDLASVVLRRVARPAAAMRNFIPRYWRLFVELPEAIPDLLAGYDLDARARSVLGMGLARYIAIAFAIWSRFGNAGDDPSKWVLSADYLAATTNVTVDEFRKVARSVSRTVPELAELYEAEFANGRRLIDHNLPAILYPLVEYSDDRYVPIDYSVLGERLLGEGLFWRIRPRKDESAGSAFGAAFGAALEEHCWQIARSVYPTCGIERLYREGKYGSGGALDGPDLAIFDATAIALVEIGSDRVRAVETLVEGDVCAFEEAVRDILVNRVEQLDRKISDFRAGRLSFDGHPNDPNTPIFPVVCFADGFPLGPFLRNRVDEAIAKTPYLKQTNVARLSILGVEDFEIACAIVERGTHTFTELLRGHLMGIHGDYLLRDHIRAILGELPMVKLLESEFEALIPKLVTEIAPSK